jgi:hypothetical protein
MRSWLRRQRVWVDFRRWQREGFARTFRRWRIYSDIPGEVGRTSVCHSPATELHLLCYRNDYLAAIWALKSFHHFAGIGIPLVIHIQGEATRRMIRRLTKHFPGARVITQAEADRIVIPELEKRGLTRLLAARAANHYTLKLTDFLLLGEAPNLLTIDSDVLFFRHPEAFLKPTGKHLFQRDPQSTYVPHSALGIEIAPCINVGMMHFRRDSVSLERCNGYLAAFPKLDGWLEQTLYALHAGEMGNAEYLPEEYLISLARGLDYSKLVARHYAGPSRPLLHEDGIPIVRAILTRGTGSAPARDR